MWFVWIEFPLLFLIERTLGDLKRSLARLDIYLTEFSWVISSRSFKPLGLEDKELYKSG